MIAVGRHGTAMSEKCEMRETCQRPAVSRRRSHIRHRGLLPMYGGEGVAVSEFSLPRISNSQNSKRIPATATCKVRLVGPSDGLGRRVRSLAESALGAGSLPR